ncbi:MAG: sulfatase [Phycisphaerales bacterium]|nr:MAG: sulfatase [Phycisphaerales bacterium]
MSTRREFLRLMGLGAALLPFHGCKSMYSSNGAGPGKGKPNFMIWIADDQFLDSVGCYGAEPSHTPNIDRLAREGLRFARAYSTSSICTPARSALLTRMYPIRNGAHPNHSGLKQDIPCMPSTMHDLGYRTGIVGKEGLHTRPTRPNNTYVWDREFPLTDQVISGAEWSEDAAKKHREMDYAGVKDSISDRSQPFLLCVASSLPHGPLLSRINNGLEGYPANNWMADFQLGKYLQMLEEAGQAENTVVIFVSDNGSNTDRSKYTLYEAGVHVPMIIRWPGHIRPNTVTDALVDFTDIMPTVLDLVGETAKIDFDGVSLVPLLRGTTDRSRSDLYLSFTGLGVNDVSDPYPIRAVVTERYKLIHFLNYEIAPVKGRGVDKSPEFELFDLIRDPDESVNLASDPSHAKTFEEMREKLNAWNLKVGDRGMATELEAVAMFPDRLPASPQSGNTD